ncbi:hypothetical protein NT04LM_3432, partial [Listeria monocytogenes FSL F2-208]
KIGGRWLSFSYLLIVDAVVPIFAANCFCVNLFFFRK